MSAFAHAGWNFLAKRSDDKLVFSWCFSLLASLGLLPFAVLSWIGADVPAQGALILLVTMTIHVAYFFLLNRAYTVGEFSLVYPTARGVGVLLIPLGGVMILGEQISLPAAAGVAMILMGVLVTRTGNKGRAPITKAVSLAVLTGVTIASYTLWDKWALSHVTPLMLNHSVFLAQAIVALPIVLARKPALAIELKERKWAIVAAAILAPAAYLLVLTALTFSRASYIGPMREVSIVIGAVLGAVLLKESSGPRRVAGAALIVIGVLVLALSP